MGRRERERVINNCVNIRIIFYHLLSLRVNCQIIMAGKPFFEIVFPVAALCIDTHPN